MPFCSSCGTDVGTGVKFCPKCGTASDGSAANPQAAAPPSAMAAPSPSAIPNENMMGALAYFTIIPPILFLVMEPYNKNSFIRFHSFQCLFFAAAAFVVNIVSTIFGMIPFIGWMIALFVPLGLVLVWALVAFKAFSGERFKLPVIGDLAEKQASAG